MGDTSPQRRTGRQHRLAEALRANLRRRKAQQKERRSQDTGSAAEADDSPLSQPETKTRGDARLREPG